MSLPLCARDLWVQVPGRGGHAGATLLRGVSLTLLPGEVLGILGPNGAGKSTLLRVLSGALVPDRGQVTLEGRPLQTWSPQALARRRALMSQHTALQFPLRVREVVLLGRIPHHRGTPSATDQAIVHAALHRTATAHLADRSWDTLSGGERQRVQLARALAQIWTGAGRVLLLDEPTASLDLAQQQHVLHQARRLADEEGVAIAVVLHDLNLAAAHTDRLLLLREGQPQVLDTPTRALTVEHIHRTFGVPVHILTHPDGGTLIALAMTAAPAAPSTLEAIP